MNKAILTAVLAAIFGGTLAAGPALGGSSPAQEAGATAGLAVSCKAREPGMREFIRQSMATIEARSSGPEDLERNMSGFVDAFARSAFAASKPAGCANLGDEYQRVYRSLGGKQSLVLSYH
jgi:hypothetical protein